MNNKASTISKIFLTTLKIGSFTFGGGMAMIPLLEEEFVKRNHWVTKEDILDMIALSQTLPGIISLNASTMMGYHVAGIPGAIAAALGIVLPSFIIISLLSSVYLIFSANPYVEAAFQGVRVCVIALVVRAVFSMTKSGVKDVFGVIIAIAAFILVGIVQVNPIFVIIGSGICGFLYGGRAR